jgi:amino acid transporter
VIDGAWDMAGLTLIAGGLFMAAWSTYGFETAVCYTREFRNPRTDTFKAILYSGLLCIFVFTVVPLAFQGSIGLGQLVTPAVVDAAGTWSPRRCTTASCRRTSTAAWAWPTPWPTCWAAAR